MRRPWPRSREDGQHEPASLLLAMPATLVNGRTFATFTFLAPIVTRTTSPNKLQALVVPVPFGAGPCAGF